MREVALVLMGTAGLTAAVATTTGATTAAVPRSARTTLEFDKNASDPTRSTLTVYYDGHRQARYRAGSGDGTRDDCAQRKGWLPSGSWAIRFKDRRFKGAKVRGYGVALENMKCSRGTVTRTDLFIHSDMRTDGTQGDTAPRRWTDTGPDDYLSDGSVKLRPADIKDLFDRLDELGWPRALKVVG
jgi:hypothetical protein